MICEAPITKQTTSFWLLVTMLLIPTLAEARLTRITPGPATVIDFPSFGATGPYLKIAGTFEGEIDPSDRRSGVIVDIGLAPTTAGKVHYSSTLMAQHLTIRRQQSTSATGS